METLQSLERGLRVLMYLNRVGFAKTTDLANALEIKRATAHRMLRVLCATKLVRMDPVSGLYTMTAHVLELSAATAELPSIPAGVEAAMREWTRKHGWPLTLTIERSLVRITAGDARNDEPGGRKALMPLRVPVDIADGMPAWLVVQCSPEALASPVESTRWTRRLRALANEIAIECRRAGRKPDAILELACRG